MDTRVMKHSNENGFTLIEVLVAMVILSIGILALTSMQTTGIKGNATANSITGAGTWAADRVEQIFAMDYGDLKDTDGDDVSGLGHDQTGTADASDVSPDGFYSIYWNVAVDEPLPHIKDVHIIVKKMDAGTQRSVTIEYKKAEFMN